MMVVIGFHRKLHGEVSYGESSFLIPKLHCELLIWDLNDNDGGFFFAGNREYITSFGEGGSNGDVPSPALNMSGIESQEGTREGTPVSDGKGRL